MGKSIMGFTLLEMMAVLAIMAILLLMALPSFEVKHSREQVNESLELIQPLKDSVRLFYLAEHKFPRTNLEAGIPKAEFLIGNYIQAIVLENGAFHITFGNKVHAKLKHKILSVRPMVVKDSPESPISWVCGNDGVPVGMIAVGINKTDVLSNHLPINCF